ncbi:MAG TPA: thioesterase family protein [Chryseosolibacter sp.]
MARIELALPEKFLFSTELSVRVTDLNYGNHVGNDSVLSLMHEARLQFYRTLGFKNELSFEGPVGQVISDAVIVYKAEAFYGDILVCEIAAADFNKYGFDLLYRLTNKATMKEVARGKTGIVCFDYDKRKVASIPAVLLDKLKTGG